jgi:hypothetical protein
MSIPIEQNAAHLHAVQILARESGRPVEEVAPVYLQALARLEPQARIRDYLILRASKQTRDFLREARAREAGPERAHQP